MSGDEADYQYDETATALPVFSADVMKELLTVVQHYAKQRELMFNRQRCIREKWHRLSLRRPFRKACVAYERRASPDCGYIRRRLLQCGWARLLLYPGDGVDKRKVWKDWERDVGKRLNCRLPGNWRTARGIKKRKKALLSLQ